MPFCTPQPNIARMYDYWLRGQAHCWDTLRQALEDAITTRAQSAAQPCQACAVCPALLCPLHAAELDWVSLYRALAHDLGITLTQAREPDTAGTSRQGRL